MKGLRLIGLAGIASLVMTGACGGEGGEEIDQGSESLARSVRIGDSPVTILATDAACDAPMYRNRSATGPFCHATQADPSGRTSGAMTFELDVARPGTYDLRGLVESFKPSFNEVFLQVDDGPWKLLGFDPTNAPKTENFGSFELGGGLHRVVLRGRALWTRVYSLTVARRPDGPPVAGDLEPVQMRVFCDGKGFGWRDPSIPEKAGRCRMYYNGLYAPGLTAATVNPMIAAIKKVNPKTLVGVYIIEYESQDPGGPATNNTGFKEVADKVTRMNWWLRTTSGQRTQWTPNYSAYNVCLTCGQKQQPDENGERAPQALARVWSNVLAPMNFDFFFNDNSILQNQGVELAGTVDYFRDGVGRRSTDPEVQDAFHVHQRQFLDAMRGFDSDRFGVANVGIGTDSYAHPSVRGQWGGANIEGYMGLWWSADSMSGWSTLYERMRALHANLGGGKFLSGMLTLEHVNYPMIRYGLTTALLLDNMLFGANIDDQGPNRPFFQVDEYLARLGNPLGGIPERPAQNGVWLRHYQGGAVVVNPNDNRGTPLYRTTLTRQNNVVTLSGWRDHGLPVGTQVKIVDNATNRSFEGIFTVTASNSAAGTLSWSQAGPNATVARGSGRLATRSTIDLRGLGLRHLGAQDRKVGAAIQDPAVNNGQPLGVEAVWSSDGFVAIKD